MGAIQQNNEKYDRNKTESVTITLQQTKEKYLISDLDLLGLS